MEDKDTADKKTVEKNPNIIVLKTKETDKFKWYVIHTYSGYENKVAFSIKDRVEVTHLDSLVSKIVVPTRKKVIVSAGKKREIGEKFVPGYIIIKMNLTDDLWHLIRRTDHVTGFIGTRTNPLPLPEEEAQGILNYMNLDTPKYEAKFKEGDSVKVLEGPFKDFLGKVDSINKEQGKVKVLISSFGREVPVEFDLRQITPL